MGDPNPEAEESLLSASGPPREEAWEKRALPGPGKDWSPGAVPAGPSCAGGPWRVELRERALHLCVLPAATARPVGSDPTRAQPGQLQLRAGVPRPGHPELRASWAGVPELSIDLKGDSLLA